MVAVLVVAFGAQLGRINALFPPLSPKKEPEPPSIMSIGKPDIAVMIPATCQLEKIKSAVFERLAKSSRGKSQI